MILHEKKVIFIHIPKNAGTSVSFFFTGEKQSNPHHTDLAILDEIKQGKYTEYFKFSIVRNPFDRIVSIFQYYVNGGNGLWYDKEIGVIFSRIGFTALLLLLRQNELSKIIPRYQQELYPHFLPQYKYIYDDSGELLLDYIGTYEKLPEHMQHIGKKFNIEGEFPHKLKSSHSPYRDYYTQELIDIVANQYQRDIELFYPLLVPEEGKI